LGRYSWYDRSAVVHTVTIATPLIAFVSVVLWFSVNPLSPNPAVEGSMANPLGLITSNFVYDGSINIENIVASLAFLLVVCFYFPRELRVFLIYLLPVAAVGAGALAEFTAISTPYVSLHLCSQACSFYGMSGVASAAIGFTTACFLVLFGAMALQSRKMISMREGAAARIVGPKGKLLVVCAFVAYILVLLLISNAIPLPEHSSGGGGGSPGGPSIPAVFVQAPPVALVHSASLVYGFLLCLGAFVQVNRHYHLMVTHPNADAGPR
jgi:hypothetical protein